MYVLPKAEPAALRVLNAVMRGCKCCTACELRLDDQMMQSTYIQKYSRGENLRLVVILRATGRLASPSSELQFARKKRGQKNPLVEVSRCMLLSPYMSYIHHSTSVPIDSWTPDKPEGILGTPSHVVTRVDGTLCPARVSQSLHMYNRHCKKQITAARTNRNHSKAARQPSVYGTVLAV